MIKKFILFALLGLALTFSQIAYASAVYTGEKEALDCPYCITVEELEFRNQNPHLFDQIGIKIIQNDATKYPINISADTADSQEKTKSVLELKMQLDKIKSQGYTRNQYQFNEIMYAEETKAKQIFNSDNILKNNSVDSDIFTIHFTEKNRAEDQSLQDDIIKQRMIAQQVIEKIIKN